MQLWLVSPMHNPRGWGGWGVMTAALVLSGCAGTLLAQGAFNAHAEATEYSAASLMPAPPRHPAGHEAAHRPQQAPAATEEAPPHDKADALLPDWFGGEPWWKWNHMTGNWGGVRDRLEEKGILIESSFTWEWSSVWSGGVRRKASDRNLFDVIVGVDLERLVGWRGAEVYADFYTTEASGGSVDAGDFQNISNIDTGDDRTQLGELWFQQRLLEDRLRVKLGKIDANSEFAYSEAGVEFLNASAGVSPTVYGMPTYPDPATGVVVFVSPAEWLNLGVGLFDGATEDGFRTGGRGPATFFSDKDSSSWFLIAEVGVSWNASREPGTGLGRGRFALGAHRHTADLETFEGNTADGVNGVYAVCEQQVWRNATSEEDADNGLWLVGQVGYGERRVSDVEAHYALGLVLRGTLSGRERDVAGVYLSLADMSDASGSPYQKDETAIELMYKAQITPWLSVTPDLQVIFNPSGDADISTAVVGGVRIVLTF